MTAWNKVETVLPGCASSAAPRGIQSLPERTLREIYLRGFGIAVRVDLIMPVGKGTVKALLTAYKGGPVFNGNGPEDEQL